jgi:adenylosuccinate lyase
MARQKDRGSYGNPLNERYASAEMSAIFSEQNKHRKWRQCWIALAEAQAELGLAITPEQLEELRAHREDINYEFMEAREREIRHDVMAAVLAYGEQCPKARPIIHLGATSCFVTDNADLMQCHEALRLILSRLKRVIAALARFAESWKSLACLGYTHLQPAQPTTLGKRACLWLQDLLICFRDMERLLAEYRLLGAKGATGTQDSFLKLFGGDPEKVRELDGRVCRKLGFAASLPISGQTYTRLLDSRIMDVLKNICAAAHKMAVDFRLLQHLRLVDEPYEEKQVGSSAMAYKRNPMRCERICSLARFVLSQAAAADQTAATQWLERSLDDSAGRRLYLPQAFLGTEAVLILAGNVLGGAVVYPRAAERPLREELPFLATEAIIMQGVLRGADRQSLHEAIRERSVAAAGAIKREAADNRLLEMLAEDPRIPFSLDELRQIAYGADFTGRAVQQVEEFLAEEVHPLLERYRDLPEPEGEVRV